MQKLKINNLNELKKLFESYGYYPTDEILYEAYLGLKRLGSGITSRGQDLYTLCFDGPAGAGKTSFVSAYIKAAKYFFDEDIEMIKYQCNDTTGSGELVEEIGMVAAVVTKDEDKIIIPGKIVEALKKVEQGKKIILFIDEFDKSRKETDVFFYEFLQSGEVNTVQMGDLSIPEKYKSNLQVFFCKNDFRELSGPLMRRTRSLLLDYMTPDLFYKIAKNEFMNSLNIHKGIPALINLVTLIYNLAYQNKNSFDRLPAPSEMLIAIEDAYELSTGLNITGKGMYSLIFKRLFKNPDDLNSFEYILENTTEKNYEGLKGFLNELKTSEEEITTEKLMQTMSDDIFINLMDAKTRELNDKIKEYDNLINIKEKELNDTLEAKLKEIEEQKEKLLQERINLRNKQTEHEDEISKINLNGGNLVLTEENNILKNFNDSTEYIRRGESIFNVKQNANWTNLLNVTFKTNNHNNLIEQIKLVLSEIGLIIYEDGILLNSNNISLIVTATIDENNNLVYNFLSSTNIIPSNYIFPLIEYIEVFENILKEKMIKTNINALIYNDEELPIDKIMDNVYNINIEVKTIEEVKGYLSNLNLKCIDKTKAIESSIELMDSQSKKLVR